MFNKKISTSTTCTITICLSAILLAIPTTVFSINFITEVVSTESYDESVHSSLTVDPEGNIHATWRDHTDYGGSGGDFDVFYKAKVGGIWATTEVVSTESTEDSGYPSLAVDIDGNVHIAWCDYTDYGGAGTDRDIFYKAKVGGIWATTEVVSTESTEDSGYPSLAVDIDGNVHIAWCDYTDYGGAGIDGDIFYKAKIDGSWTTTEVVSTESTVDSEFSSLAIDLYGNIHIAWQDYSIYDGSGGDIDIFYKAKVGGIWATTEVVSTESTEDSLFPSLAVDPDGNIYIAWMDETWYGLAGPDKDIFYKVKLNGSWSTTEVVSTESTDDCDYPSLAVDPDGIIHATWHDDTDYDGAGPDRDIFYKAKIDGSWTITEVVSTESGHDSIRPSLTVSADKKVHVTWSDFSDHDGEKDFDIYYKMIMPPTALLDLKTRIDDIEAKLDDPNTGLAPIKSEVDKIEGKLDILLERLGIVGGLMLPTEGLKLVIDLFVNNAAAMVLGILLLIGLPLLMRKIKKKG